MNPRPLHDDPPRVMHPPTPHGSWRFRSWFRVYPLTTGGLLLYLALFPVLVFHNPWFQPLGLCLIWPLILGEVMIYRGPRALSIGGIELSFLVVLLACGATFLHRRGEMALFEGLERMVLPVSLFFFFIALRAALADPTRVDGISRGRRLTVHLVVLGAGIAIPHLVTGLIHFVNDETYRIGAHIGNPNFYAAFMGALFFLLLPSAVRLFSIPFPTSSPTLRSFFGEFGGLVFSRKGLSGLIGFAGLMLFPLLIVVTRSRGAALTFLLMLGLFTGIRRGPVRAVVLIAILALLILVIPNPLAERLDEINPHPMMHPRPFIWRVYTANLMDHPLGMGPNMGRYYFATKALEFAPLEDLVFFRYLIPPHNLFLQAGADGGWIALAGVIMGLALVTRHLVRNRKGILEDPLRFGAGLGLFGLILHSQVDSLDYCYFLVVLGALLAALVLSTPPPPGPEHGPSRSRGSRLRWIPALAGGFIALITASVPLSALCIQRAEISPEQIELTPVQAAWLDRAEWLCPVNHEAPAARFQVSLNRLLAEGELSDWKTPACQSYNALLHHPLSGDLARKTARFYALLPQHCKNQKTLMETFFRYADRRDPLNVMGRFNGLAKRFIPNEPSLFLKATAPLNRLNLAFPLLDYHRGICLERLNRPGPALAAYRQSVRNWKRARHRLKAFPAHHPGHAFLTQNVSRFPRERVYRKIISLDRAHRSVENRDGGIRDKAQRDKGGMEMGGR